VVLTGPRCGAFDPNPNLTLSASGTLRATLAKGKQFFPAASLQRGHSSRGKTGRCGVRTRLELLACMPFAMRLLFNDKSEQYLGVPQKLVRGSRPGDNVGDLELGHDIPHLLDYSAGRLW
jgi:hypothetical protein